MSGLPSWARKGAKVVCVGRERAAGEPKILNDRGIRWLPTSGKIYTISGTIVRAPYGCFLFLQEHPEPHCFHAGGFRPLVTTKTEAEDAAMFRGLIRQNMPEAA